MSRIKNMIKKFFTSQKPKSKIYFTNSGFGRDKNDIDVDKIMPALKELNRQAQEYKKRRTDK